MQTTHSFRRFLEQTDLGATQEVHIIYVRQIARHGGASGLRDVGLLQNVLQRPVNKWQYEEADIFECAAEYGFGIVKVHAFVDGSK